MDVSLCELQGGDGQEELDSLNPDGEEWRQEEGDDRARLGGGRHHWAHDMGWASSKEVGDGWN